MPPRLPVIDASSGTPEQKLALLEWQVDRGSASPPGDFFGVLVASPEGMRRLSKVGAFSRFGTMLPELTREAAVYATNTHAGDSYEMRIHGQKLVELGLEPGVLESLREGGSCDLPDGARQAVDLARAMLLERRVSQEVFDAARRAFGDQGTVELSIVISYYDLIGRLRHVFTPDE